MVNRFQIILVDVYTVEYVRPRHCPFAERAADARHLIAAASAAPPTPAHLTSTTHIASMAFHFYRRGQWQIDLFLFVSARLAFVPFLMAVVWLEFFVFVAVLSA